MNPAGTAKRATSTVREDRFHIAFAESRSPNRSEQIRPLAVIGDALKTKFAATAQERRRQFKIGT